MHADHDEPGTDAVFVTNRYPDTLFHDNAFAHGDAYVVYTPESDPNADDTDSEPHDTFTHTNRHGDTFSVVIADANAVTDPVGGEQLHPAALGVRLPRRDEHRRSARYPAHRRQR